MSLGKSLDSRRQSPRIIKTFGISVGMLFRHFTISFQQKDESDSEVCIRLVNLLCKSGSIVDGFSRCLNCINAGRHIGIAGWFHNCLSLLEVSALLSYKSRLACKTFHL